MGIRAREALGSPGMNGDNGEDDGMALEYEMVLPESGFEKSLGKAKKYFSMIEEYETCDLIKQMQKQIS